MQKYKASSKQYGLSKAASMPKLQMERINYRKEDYIQRPYQNNSNKQIHTAS